MKYIETFREGMHVSDVYLCKTKQIALTKNGKEYGSVTLQDKTGTIDGKIWDLGSPGIGEFGAMDYIFIDADVTMFQGAFQLNIRRVRVADEGEYYPGDYLPMTTKDINAMVRELGQYITTIKNEHLRKLAAGYFVNDQKFMKAFCSHSAAKSVHHGFVGGLLEHTLSVVKMCDFFCKQYPNLNRDLLLTAAMFHDIGKVKELSSFPENDYTDEGQLIGHIIIGAQMVQEGAAKIAGFPKKLENELVHCVLAHHGELEYGSPKKPALIEAMALNLADNADAKLETMTEILRGAGDNNGWLGYNRFMESNIRKTSEF
ncbi:MAG: HD domain-containing protein [Lachnospiraceae bacterium]|nr:HD domain-containing protein [Lachnospiraceae bacterium]MBQ1240697.1 HD domain-containing protein [Lachnospiraceae bacterium]MBQ2023312.1 HD domain-containing protein [Lachnospiraceae bacterium]MBQ2250488.1 HD domain-containing protein [Lachnospiraceae bacterium]MBQ2400633.1 HD domain-containing protein [Lachnospiraceae bacterium]